MKLSELISSLETLRDRKGDIEVVGYSDMAAEVFEIQSLDDIFSTADDMFGDDADMIRSFPDNALFVSCL